MSTSAEPVRVTRRQFEIMDFIRSHSLAKGFPPTQNEIAFQFGFASVNAVSEHVALLVAKGCVTRERGKNRSLVVTEGGKNAWVGKRWEVREVPVE